MKKTDITKLFAFGAVALASSFACAQTASAPKSSVQLYGIVDVAYRHTNNEGAGKDGLTKMIGGGMSQSRWGINVEEAWVAGPRPWWCWKTVSMPMTAVFPPPSSNCPIWVCKALMAA